MKTKVNVSAISGKDFELTGIPIKKCSCGRVFQCVPDAADFAQFGGNTDGYYWNCDGTLKTGKRCDSTLFVPVYGPHPKREGAV